MDLDVDNRTVRITALSLLVGSRSDAFCVLLVLSSVCMLFSTMAITLATDKFVYREVHVYIPTPF